MSDEEDGGASTGVSPHRKQQRGQRSDRVTTRGLVPVPSPDPASAAAASCSPAGRVERPWPSAGAEVSVLFELASRASPSEQHEGLARAITAVPARTFLDACQIVSSSNSHTPARLLLQLPAGRHFFPDGGRARPHGCGLHPDSCAARELTGWQLHSHPGVVGRVQGGGAHNPAYRLQLRDFQLIRQKTLQIVLLVARASAHTI